MKKIRLITTAVAFGFTGFSQVNSVVEAPQNNGSTTQIRAPNGLATYAYQRGCFLVTQAELANIPNGTNISSFGFTLSAGAALAVAGNFTLFVQNTTDAAYLKGTNFPTAVSTMSNVFANVMSVPMSVGTNSIFFALSSPFIYTGGALYVAFDWFSPGPYSATPATYLAENGINLNPGGATAFAGTAPTPITLSNTAFRPAFLFGFPNPNNNDISVVGIETPGKVAFSLNTPHTIVGVIRNTSNISRSNITVSLTVSGVTPVNATQMITSIAPGAVQSLTFGPYNPQISGANSISVSVAPDQVNSNNLSTYSQSITCSTWAQNPAIGSYTSGVGFTTGAIISSKYLNVNTSTLTAMNFGLSTDPLNVNNTGYAVLLSSTGVILATSNTVILTTQMLGTTINFNFSPGIVLLPSTTYYIGAAQPIAGYSPAGGFTVPYVIPNTYYFCNLNGGAFTSLPNNLGYFRIEGVFSPSMSVTASAPNVCSGSAITLTATGPTSYTWNQGSTALSNNQILNISPLISTVYSIVGTNTLGCNYNFSYSVAVNPLPNVTIASNSNSVCVGADITFTANGAAAYSVNAISSQSVITKTPVANTIYTVSGINANNCVNTATLDVTVATLSVTVSTNTTICKGKSITLFGSGLPNYIYNWAVGNLNLPFSSAAVSPTVTSTYTLTTTDGYCSLASLVTVTVNPVPTVTLSSSKPTSCRGEAITISGNSAGNYVWNNNSAVTLSITVSPLVNTVYNVTVTNSEGCSGTALLSQNVVFCTAISEAGSMTSSLKIFPNPNNGQFTISTDNLEAIKTMEIYNALGALVKRLEISSNRVEIDLISEANGIYFVKMIENSKTIQVSKIVKQ